MQLFFTLWLVAPPNCLNVKAVTEKAENNLSENEGNLANHKHMMWQDAYTFKEGILMQAVLDGDTHHGGVVRKDLIWD